MTYQNHSVSRAADIFKALGDGSRLKILKLIAAKGNLLCVGYIAKHIGLSQPAVSQHLKLLKSVGILSSERQRFHVHYRIDESALASFGVDTMALLKSFGAEMDLTGTCEHHDDEETCTMLNSTV
ncbi:MAG: winged helix-turn-helix transcriptional regulator [Deltaproteobacteria bacterium]|nr:winged helix-turn-helix transcriptional regulator [Deltaproteobacteria bacterium]